MGILKSFYMNQQFESESESIDIASSISELHLYLRGDGNFIVFRKGNLDHLGQKLRIDLDGVSNHEHTYRAIWFHYDERDTRERKREMR
jgi:hypothetical protein